MVPQITWRPLASGPSVGRGGVLLVETVRKSGLAQAMMITNRLCVLLGEVL
jgi:hypothetical protein